MRIIRIIRKCSSVLFIFFAAVSAIAQDKNYSEWYLIRPNTEIYVRELGKGKDVVVVVHGGFGANHDYMLDAVKGLENDFRFVLYDQRGSLLSPASKEDLTFQNNVKDLYELIKQLRVGKVKILAHSMGTLVAMEFQKQHPEMVSNLMLAGAIHSVSESTKPLLNSERIKKQIAELSGRKEVEELLRPYRNRDKAKIVDNVKGQQLSPEFAERSGFTHRELTEIWRIHFASINIFDMSKTNLLKGGKSYYKGGASVMSQTVDWDFDYRESLNKNGRVTLVQGNRDFLDFDAELHRENFKEFVNVRIDVVKDAGHNIWIDKPQEFRELAKRALNRK